MTKAQMLEAIRENGWECFTDVDSKSSYDEVKEAYDVMMDELSSDSDMFPNGHDDGEEYEDF